MIHNPSIWLLHLSCANSPQILGQHKSKIVRNEPDLLMFNGVSLQVAFKLVRGRVFSLLLLFLSYILSEKCGRYCSAVSYILSEKYGRYCSCTVII